MATKPFNVREIMRSVDTETTAIGRAIITSMAATVILSTPVGMPASWRSPPPPGYQPGHARYAWRASLGAPITNDRRGEDPSGTPTIAEAEGVARNWTPDVTFFLSNNAPYIVALDEGWSPQAGANFTQKAMLQGLNAVSDTRLELP